MDALLQALNALLGREPGPPPHIDWRLRQQARRTAEAQEPPPSIEPPPACGWFDSSHDLVSGLRVQELASNEALSVLPLGLWLELQLADCSTPPAGPATDFER